MKTDGDRKSNKVEIDSESLNKKEIHVKGFTDKKGHYHKPHARKIKAKVTSQGNDVYETITDYEDKIRHQDYESSGVVDSDGNLIFTKSGEKDRIDFTDEEMVKFKGCVFTHNHPRSVSFSDADIAFACRAGVKEMRVVVPEGKVYIMKLKNGDNFTYDMWTSDISLLESAFNNEIHEEFSAKIYDGRMTIEEANSKHHNELWYRVVEHLPELEYIGD